MANLPITSPAGALGFILATLIAFGAPVGAQSAAPTITDGADTIHVAPPTGEMEADRASILDAFGRARAGSTVRFAPGTYLVGEVIEISIPALTILGHPDGTTLRGCDQARIEETEELVVKAIRAPTPEGGAALRDCGIFNLTGGHAVVRHLTFENSWYGLLFGCCNLELAFRPTEGGYRIEDNTFRNSGNGVRSWLSTSEPTVIRGNRFINTFHAVTVAGSHFHILDNDVTVPQPERVPWFGYPGFAMAISAILVVPADDPDHAARTCAHNVVEGNRIEGHPDGISSLSAPGHTCRQNEIRDNTIVAAAPSFDPGRPSGERFSADDAAPSIITGVPLSLFAFADQEGNTGRMEESVIEGNRIIGAHGVAIELVRASGNRIANNVITGVQRRDPFPGNVIGLPPAWGDANGAGIWVSPGSDRNEIVGNAISGTAAEAIVLEGEGNRVETVRPGDEVRDEGTGNTVNDGR